MAIVKVTRCGKCHEQKCCHVVWTTFIDFCKFCDEQERISKPDTDRLLKEADELLVTIVRKFETFLAQNPKNKLAYHVALYHGRSRAIYTAYTQMEDIDTNIYVGPCKVAYSPLVLQRDIIEHSLIPKDDPWHDWTQSQFFTALAYVQMRWRVFKIDQTLINTVRLFDIILSCFAVCLFDGDPWWRGDYLLDLSPRHETRGVSRFREMVTVCEGGYRRVSNEFVSHCSSVIIDMYLDIFAALESKPKTKTNTIRVPPPHVIYGGNVFLCKEGVASPDFKKQVYDEYMRIITPPGARANVSRHKQHKSTLDPCKLGESEYPEEAIYNIQSDWQAKSVYNLFSEQNRAIREAVLLITFNTWCQNELLIPCFCTDMYVTNKHILGEIRMDIKLKRAHPYPYIIKCAGQWVVRHGRCGVIVDTLIEALVTFVARVASEVRNPIVRKRAKEFVDEKWTKMGEAVHNPQFPTTYAYDPVPIVPLARVKRPGGGLAHALDMIERQEESEVKIKRVRLAGGHKEFKM